MRLPTANHWLAVRELTRVGSIGIYPGDQTSQAIAAVLDYVTDMEDALAGLTPEQVAAIPRLVAWWTTPGGEMHRHVPEEMDELGRIFPPREDA